MAANLNDINEYGYELSRLLVCLAGGSLPLSSGQTCCSVSLTLFGGGGSLVEPNSAPLAEAGEPQDAQASRGEVALWPQDTSESEPDS